VSEIWDDPEVAVELEDDDLDLDDELDDEDAEEE
jgi:hypothetical protein